MAAMKVELRAFFPTCGTQTTEERVYVLKKSVVESLSKFIQRFINLARSLIDEDGLSKDKTIRALFQKLPKPMQQQLSILAFTECKLANL